MKRWTWWQNSGGTGTSWSTNCCDLHKGSAPRVKTFKFLVSLLLSMWFQSIIFMRVLCNSENGEVTLSSARPVVVHVGLLSAGSRVRANLCTVRRSEPSKTVTSWSVGAARPKAAPLNKTSTLLRSAEVIRKGGRLNNRRRFEGHVSGTSPLVAR